MKKNLKRLYNMLCFNRIKNEGKNNHKSLNGRIKKTNICYYGNNNVLIVEKGAFLEECTILFYGNNNKMIIHKGVHIVSGFFTLENGNAKIEIGEGTFINCNSNIKCGENVSIFIGWGCQIGINFIAMSSDGHYIYNPLTKEILNNPCDIVIGNHVWIGANVTTLKKTLVSDNSIIASNTLITKQFNQKNVLIAGIPSKIIKNNMSWSISKDSIN